MLPDFDAFNAALQDAAQDVGAHVRTWFHYPPACERELLEQLRIDVKVHGPVTRRDVQRVAEALRAQFADQGMWRIISVGSIARPSYTFCLLYRSPARSAA